MQIPPISSDRVNGLNLTVPEDAKEVIKSWDQRENTDKYIDSGVDDQVRRVQRVQLARRYAHIQT